MFLSDSLVLSLVSGPAGGEQIITNILKPTLLLLKAQTWVTCFESCGGQCFQDGEGEVLQNVIKWSQELNYNWISLQRYKNTLCFKKSFFSISPCNPLHNLISF